MSAANTSWMHRRLPLVVIALLAALAGAADAQPTDDTVSLEVINRDTGGPLQVWRRHGEMFVAGEAGKRYSLRVTNHTNDRVLVVMSVDGVNILTGETASYDQRGYVFDAHDAYDVSGWRKSNTEIAAFAFTSLPKSYAARTGRPGDVGVIGMAVFPERRPPEASAVAPPDLERRRHSSPPVFLAPQAGAPAPSQGPVARSMAATSDQPPRPPAAKSQDDKLGTDHGPKERSLVTLVTFERATSYPQTVRQLRYDTYDHLVASGVILLQPGQGHRPDAFPSDLGGEGYVPDPPGSP